VEQGRVVWDKVERAKYSWTDAEERVCKCVHACVCVSCINVSSCIAVITNEFSAWTRG
jgi:hypothetical protein